MEKRQVTEEEQLKRAYYELVGDWNLPIVHMGGLAATAKLLEMCGVDEQSKVLDVGCGVGYTVFEIARKYRARVVGIDLSENMIANAKKEALSLGLEEYVEFRVEDVTELPFDDASFDVVIMDVQMPIMDGLEATRLIRQYEKDSGRRTPIVAVTAGIERSSCMGAGMNDYLAKPVRVPDFHQVLERHCA